MYYMINQDIPTMLTSCTPWPPPTKALQKKLCYICRERHKHKYNTNIFQLVDLPFTQYMSGYEYKLKTFATIPSCMQYMYAIHVCSIVMSLGQNFRNLSHFPLISTNFLLNKCVFMKIINLFLQVIS